MDREYVSRRAGRFVPSTSVTVALLEENLPIAYGVVQDISERGARIMTNTSLSPGRTYQFRMSFFGGEILEAVARVVWRENHRPNGSEPVGVPHGIEFVDINDANLENLRRILQSGAFGSKPIH
ncbi:MAG: PilZ domain-containing protein [Vicinamibacteria bacterium]